MNPDPTAMPKWESVPASQIGSPRSTQELNEPSEMVCSSSCERALKIVQLSRVCRMVGRLPPFSGSIFMTSILLGIARSIEFRGFDEQREHVARPYEKADEFDEAGEAHRSEGGWSVVGRDLKEHAARVADVQGPEGDPQRRQCRVGDSA